MSAKPETWLIEMCLQGQWITLASTTTRSDALRHARTYDFLCRVRQEGCDATPGDNNLGLDTNQ
jgi:hypothetical protein